MGKANWKLSSSARLFAAAASDKSDDDDAREEQKQSPSSSEKKKKKKKKKENNNASSTRTAKGGTTTAVKTLFSAEEILEKRRLERQRTPLSEARLEHLNKHSAKALAKKSEGGMKQSRGKTRRGKARGETMDESLEEEEMRMKKGAHPGAEAFFKDYSPAIENEAKILGVSPHLIRGRRYFSALPPGSKRVIPREVWKICERLSGRGYKAYIVGGAVRDLLQGAKPRDFDVMTNAKYKDIQQVFGWKRVRVVGRRFKVAHVRTGPEHGGRPYVEVSSCTEGDEENDEKEDADNDEDEDGEYDPSWQSPSRMYLRKDAHKRDFTVNGMAYELLKNVLHDYVDGFEDSRENIVRSIGKPHVAFKEDPARILRAIRVSAKRNMEPTKEVRATMRAYAPLLNELNRERKMLETRACLARGYSKIGMKMLWMSSTLDVLMPTVASFIKERGGKKRTMLEFQKTGFDLVLDEKSWDEEKKEFRTIFMNSIGVSDDVSNDDVANDVDLEGNEVKASLKKKQVPSGVTAGGLFKLLECLDGYVEKDVKLTEEGISTEFLVATLATPIALFYSGLKTVPKYSTRKREVEILTKKSSRGGKKTKTVTEINPAWLRWTAACERVLRELSEVDGLILSLGRRSNTQGWRTYQMMTRNFMNKSSSSSSSSSSAFSNQIELDDDEEEDDDLEDAYEDLIDYKDELSGKKHEEWQALVEIVHETFGVPETDFEEDI